MTDSNIFNGTGTLHPNIAGMYSRNYANFIQSPSQLGIRVRKRKKHILSNIDKLSVYDNILMSDTEELLGSKYFSLTGNKCIDASNNVRNRSVYINSVRPSATPGKNQGFVPSIITDLQEINPIALYNIFTNESNPKCTRIEMDTTNNIDKTITTTSGYVADSEIEAMSACWFQDKKNPITSETCAGALNPAAPIQSDGFSNISPNSNMPNDPYIKAYFFSLGILGFYILTKMVIRK
jgi:hypothetical protein